jgi:hypothetical protein
MSSIISLTSSLSYTYNSSMIFIYTVATISVNLSAWSTITIAALPAIFNGKIILATAVPIINSNRQYLRGSIAVNLQGEIYITAWDEGISSSVQTIGGSPIIVPIK